MHLRMWTYDIAREQSPDREVLARMCDLTVNAGYNAIGLYLEHRFAYPTTPWSHGKGCITPDDIRWLQDRYPELKIVPLLNLLGHFEGMIYTEAGAQYACERFAGMQADPTNEAFIALCRGIIDDAIDCFSSDLIHIGGDETWQLGAGAPSEAKVRAYEADGEGIDGKAKLYGNHFGPLAEYVVEKGRRPAVWGDMFYDHPQALPMLPQSTVVFDWQYFRSADGTAQRFRDAGHEVVLCPAIHTYNALWCHLPQSERNIKENAAAAKVKEDLGVCVTTWECGLFGNYETLIPAIRAAGRILNDDSLITPVLPVGGTEGLGGTEAIEEYRKTTEAPEMLAAYLEVGENAETWARLMGCQLQEAGDIFQFGGIRSALKCRLLLYSNPFLLWLRNRDALLGEPGTRAKAILDEAMVFAPDAAYRGVVELGSLAIQFVQFAEKARIAYAEGKPGEANTHLSVCRQVFEHLERFARTNHHRIGGSLADIERCRIAREHVERVIRRVKEYGDGSLGYLPSFETLTHPKFVPHDQANWWLINRWANE